MTNPVTDENLRVDLEHLMDDLQESRAREREALLGYEALIRDMDQFAKEIGSSAVAICAEKVLAMYHKLAAKEPKT